MHFINSEELQMKALNSAIARTVSQIARHAGEGCHVPMIMALENHLDALLTMERKMLECVQEVTWPDGQYWTPERVAAFNRWENAKPPWENVQPTHHANDNTQPAPNVIDMTDPRNWKVGDVVVRKHFPASHNFTPDREYIVHDNNGRSILVYGDDGEEISYPLFGVVKASHFFQWLRHREAQS